MATRHKLVLAAAALAALLLGAACQGNLDEIVADFNARATQVAGGTLAAEATLSAILVGTPVPEGFTPPPANTFDLTTNYAATLAQAWGQTYALPSGSQFEIRATQQQMGDYVIQQLQVTGWERTARGGSIAIALGQVRLDLALEDSDGNFGAGTVSFQPTLDATGRLRLNPQGGDFGGLRMPDNFTPALGDAVHTALSGARDASLSRVSLTRLMLENGVLDVAGTVR
jgi:hypothetical protein